MPRKKRAVQEKANADRNARDAQLQASRAEEQQRRAEASRAAARRHAYVSDMRLASQSYQAGNIDHVVELLEKHWPDSPGDEDVRGFEWYHWWKATRLHRQSTHAARPPIES